jgi:hypothetical protein
MKKLTAVNPDAGVALLGICLDSHPRFQDAGNFVPDGELAVSWPLKKQSPRYSTTIAGR